MNIRFSALWAVFLLWGVLACSVAFSQTPIQLIQQGARSAGDDPYGPLKTGNEIAIWGFDDQGRTLTDKSGNGHDALAGGSETPGTYDPTPTATGWYFDAIDDVAIIDESLVFTGAFEVIFAWRPENTSVITYAWGQGSGDPWAFIVSSTTSLVMRFGSASVSFTVPAFTLGEHYIVALVKDATNDVRLRILGDDWTAPQNINLSFVVNSIGRAGLRDHKGEFNLLRFSSGDTQATLDDMMLAVKALLEERGLTISTVSP